MNNAPADLAPRAPSAQSHPSANGASPSTDASAEKAAQFVAIEHEILKLWESQDTFNARRATLKGKPLFRFLDGPITANNPMGVHHAWGRTLKDIFIRYKNLQGFDCRFQNGFDCQGLWVEVEVEKELGFKGKPDIEAYGLDKFSEACKQRIAKFSSIQTQQSIRLGQWMDWENSYYTHTDKNIQGIWAFLKKCHENGWLYRSYLPMPWCTRCGTSLSEHEMSGSYKDLEHLAVYLKPFLPSLHARILVWTTTPWTLPANAALAVNPELEYSLVKIDGELLPLLLSTQVFENWRKGGWRDRNPQVVKTFRGTELEGVAYEPLFRDIPLQKGFSHRIVLWKDVDPKEGTGVVHIAPGCGREDFELSKTVDIQRLIPVDEKGDYVKECGFLSGKNAKTIAEEVASHLKSHDLLYSKYMHTHSYPVCWRCKDELIFRLVGEWYISSQEIRPKLLEAARTVRWQPEHVGKRMEDWLRNMGDWCISRKRFWGLPLPFYQCTACDHLTVVGSTDEIAALGGTGIKDLPELHRPWIDQISIACPKCSEKSVRVSEVGDCWLDAGIVPYSTLGCYQQAADGSTTWAPADWICEMSEQVRLWFYSMLFMGVTLGERAPYKHVLTYERVLAEDGTKFSKTGYMIRFDEAAERMGVDTMRYYFASQAPTSDLRFGYAQGDDARRQLISLWNIYSFFMTYADIDNPQSCGAALDMDRLSASDRWLLASLYSFVQQAQQSYEQFNTAQLVRHFEEFIEGVSNWYIRSNRRRFWKSEAAEDKECGYRVLFQVLRSATCVMSPVIPFLSEKIWQTAVRRFVPQEAASVHLSTWPSLPSNWDAPDLVAQVSQVRQVLNLALRLRAESRIKVRQPLRTLSVTASESHLAALRAMESMVLGEVNVKRLEFLKSKEDLFDSYLELDLKKSGPVLRGEVNKVMALVNSLDLQTAQPLVARVLAGDSISLPGHAAELPASIFVVRHRPKPHTLSVEDHGVFVALDTTLTEELEHEGWVRDVLRQAQVLRKESGFLVTDRISLVLATNFEPARKVFEQQRALIEAETLGRLEILASDAAQAEQQMGARGFKTVAVDLDTLRGETFVTLVAAKQS
jgi:isoleucyl-tRNA synthetase